MAFIGDSSQKGTLVRNPYIVGGWVSGPAHYGRRGLISHLIEGPNDALWVVGTRRIGKTSLLRQTEILTQQHERYVPLFLDLQGVATSGELSQELFYAVEEVGQRFEAYNVDVDALEKEDAVGVLRVLRRQLGAANRTLLLLIDEPEALVSLGVADSQFLQRLRKALLAGPTLRTVMVSTKGLLQLNEITSNWPTSPFLTGFSPRNLAGLDRVAASSLIRQEQSATPVQVTQSQIEWIREQAGDHPYLVQILCQRLWQEDHSLRDIVNEDLNVDDMLGGFFQNDFGSLSPAERRILLFVSQEKLVYEADVRAATGLPEREAMGFIYGLIKLGYLRVVLNQLAVGNHFLDAWLDQNRTRLEKELTSTVSDATSHRLLEAGRREEMVYLHEQLALWRNNLAELEIQRIQHGLDVPLRIINDINNCHREIERLERQLSDLADGLAHAHTEMAREPGSRF